MSAGRKITTLSSREFNQDTGKAKKATEHGPVFITDRGHAAHVLLTIRDYQELVGPRANIVDLLAMPSAEDIELELPSVQHLYHLPDLSD